jgi:hypothetical protein
VDSKAALIPGWTPYSYSFNNSIFFIVPDGQLPIPMEVMNVISQKIFELREKGIVGGGIIGDFNPSGD